MNRIKENWAVQSTKEKILTVLVLLMGLTVIISAILGLLGVLEPQVANLCLIPAMGVLTLINGLTQRKKNKKIGIFLLVCAGIILLCAAVALVVTLV